MDRSWQCIATFMVVLQLMNFKMPCLAMSPTTSLSLTTDQSALLAFKAHIMLDPYGIITGNWTNSSFVCTWIGVTCSFRHRRVASLNISDMGVTGTIPPHLGNLSFLVSLDLRYNFLSGTVPQQLSKLHRLKAFSLGINNLTGEIPLWLGFLPKLEILSFANNSFTGSIPNSISNLSNLEMLDFSYNHLSGPIPLAIFNLSNLKKMGFTYNHLDGRLEDIDICQHLPFLEKLQLSMNRLTGQIPRSVSKCSKLKVLGMAYNFFSGEIPREIGKLQSLSYLYLAGNLLNGVIPQDIGNLQNLMTFSIAQNQITGTLPLSIFNISSLQKLDLAANKLTGSLQSDIANLTILQMLELSENSFTGVLPQEIGKLDQLQMLSADNNNFTCSISHELFNISTLRVLSLSRIDLAGQLPSNFGYRLPQLEELYLEQNNLSGAIPYSISNCSNLRTLSLAGNKLSGFVPHFFGDLRLLEGLYLHLNNLRHESSSSELSFVTSLANCRFFKYLSITLNPLHGIIPSSIGNLSQSIQIFHAAGCNIKGAIPPEIGKLRNLVSLALHRNELTGNIPHSVKHMHMLQRLFLDRNNMRGSIPDGLCNLSSLGEINLSLNKFSGSIPDCLGNATSLRHLHLYSNMLNSTIPSSIWQLKNLLVLDLAKNSLSGFLPPEISNLAATTTIDLSMNQFSGHIPDTIGKLNNLGELYLDHNSIHGSIPLSMGSMVNLENLDLAYNNLSGAIPMSLQALQHLSNFNVSFNALTGEIPQNGVFRGFTAESFMGNEALCGIAKFHVPPCPGVSKSESRRKKVKFALFILSGVIAGIIVIALAFIFIMRCRRKDKAVDTSNALMPLVPERVSYHQLLRVTEEFNESNSLGKGSFGSVYKGDFGDGKILAVKVFNLQSEAAFRSFDVECQVLRSIRHRNLTKVVGSCTNMEFRALVLEYMPNGSLEKWLYSQNDCLDALQRMNIMIDAASALEYLHYGYSTPIIHCDVKPSNVLLDEEMVGHVSDFGIAKLLGEGESVAHTITLATLGYIAPEYGLEGLVSTKCDVYSYGIMLMETFSRKRPSDEMFTEDSSIKHWVESLIPESPIHVVDPKLLNHETKHFDKNLHCVSCILDLALKCTAELPGDRINMKEALAELQKIKCQFLA